MTRHGEQVLPAKGAGPRLPPDPIRDAWRHMPGAHFAIAAGLGIAWGLANSLGWLLGDGTDSVAKTTAHFVYEGLLPMLALVLAIGVADQTTRGDPEQVAPYAIAALIAAVAGELVFIATAPLVGLGACHCSMDEWPPGARPANMLPDSLLICGFVALGYCYRRRAAQRNARLHSAQLERARLTRQTQESKLQAMQACIEPEFLFDTLAEVERLHASDADTATRLLDELIVYLRAALPHLRETTSTVAKECDLAYAYLNIQKLRNAGRLAFAFEVDADVQEASMPPMVLLPMLGHAVRVGLDAGAGGESLRIVLQRAAASLRLQVHASGAAFRPGGPGRDIVAGIRERLLALYGDAARIELGADGLRTSTLTLEIPHERAHGDPR